MLNRLESLDWLRGLMALSIMLYHFVGKPDAFSPLGRLGTYGVSIFFILSGLSMAIAYDRFIQDGRSSIRFFVRRLFRILPLFWIAVMLVAVPAYLRGHGPYGQEPYSLTVILLNLTTLFGFVAPTEYINMGAWSIGNEMVYYAMTPIIVLLYHRRKAFGNLFTLLAIGIGLYFAFSALSPRDTLASQWSTYVNPFNNFFLYCAGLAIYYNFRDLSVPSKWHPVIVLLPAILFFIYPASGDQIRLVTGVNRIVLSAISILIVFAFYKCALALPKAIANGLEHLGVATYGVYILHPIVLDFTANTLQVLRIQVKLLPQLLAVGLSVILALATYRFIEAPLTSLGKRLTRGGASNPTGPHISSSTTADR